MPSQTEHDDSDYITACLTEVQVKRVDFWILSRVYLLH